MLLKSSGIKYVLAVFLFTFLIAACAGGGKEVRQLPDGVAASAKEINPLKVGATVPKVTLMTVDGKPFDLNASIAEKPIVLVFYRGGW